MGAQRTRFSTPSTVAASASIQKERPSRSRPLPIANPDFLGAAAPTPTQNRSGSNVLRERNLSENNITEERVRSHSQPPPMSPKQHPFGSLSTSRLPRVPEVQTPITDRSHGPGSIPAAPESTQKPMSYIYVHGKAYGKLNLMGKGGSSQVYQVCDENYALKAIKIVDLSETDEAQAEGYRNEIHLLQKLQGHSRIVRLYDYEHREDEDKLYIVMEKGETDLATLLKRMSAEHPITDVQRKFYWHEMLEAVQVIHNNDIIHSDLKPANFILVAGTLKLIDFGIASSVQSDKTSVFKESQMGTFNFMSPEAIQDVDPGDEDDHTPRIKISRKSDVWSLGCILYHLTYREMPFGRLRRALDKLRAITDPNHKIRFPEEGHDPLLIDTIKRCLVRDPAERASVEELLQHPYLTSKSSGNANSSVCATPKPAMELLFSQLSSALTPNTRRGLSRAMQKISSSDSNLEALKNLDLEH